MRVDNTSFRIFIGSIHTIAIICSGNVCDNVKWLPSERTSVLCRVPSYDSNNLLFEMSSGLNKAKRSLSSRLEQVWKYNRTRDDTASSGLHPEPLIIHQVRCLPDPPRGHGRTRRTRRPAGSPASGGRDWGIWRCGGLGGFRAGAYYARCS